MNRFKKFITWLFPTKHIARLDGTVYLTRYTILTLGAWFSVKLHNIKVGDDACMHDHPWPYLSIILSGGYTEYTKHSRTDPPPGHSKNDPWVYSVATTSSKEGIRPGDGYKFCKFKRGSILIRPAEYMHYLKLNAYNKPTWTLVFSFKHVRPWGFWTAHGHGRFIPWRDYIQRGIHE